MTNIDINLNAIATYFATMTMTDTRDSILSFDSTDAYADLLITDELDANDFSALTFNCTSDDCLDDALELIRALIADNRPALTDLIRAAADSMLA